MKGNSKMADLNKLVEDLSSLTILEASNLKTLLEEKWGVTAAAAAPMMMAMPTGAAAAAPEEVEEQTEFTVILKDAGPRKSTSSRQFVLLPIWA